MRKQSVACICSVVLLASGCGGGGRATNTISAARRTAACATVIAAQKRYVTAAGRMGLAFLNKPLERSTRAAAEAFRHTLEVLRRASSDSDAREIDQLVLGLSEQEKMFRAFDAHRLGEAAKFGNELDTSLRQALTNLHEVCPGA